MKKVGVIFGGASNEHAVSLMSANNVFKNIDYTSFEVIPFLITSTGKWVKYAKLNEPITSLNELWIDEPEYNTHVSKSTNEVDVFLSVIHGETGEDGKLQGFFELIGKPYVGCNVESSALSMNKILAKEIAHSFSGVPIVPYQIIRKNEWDSNEEHFPNIDFPVFVKPSRAGSSVGVTKAYNKKEYNMALQIAFDVDDTILVEKYIDGKEVEVGILGCGSVEASRVGEISFSSDFYDYDNKYLTNNSTMHIPARISEKLQEETKEYAESIFKALGCKGYSRIDFFVEKNTDKIFFNEINTSPGMTDSSMFPVLFQNKYSFTEILTKLINEGLTK